MDKNARSKHEVDAVVLIRESIASAIVKRRHFNPRILPHRPTRRSIRFDGMKFWNKVLQSQKVATYVTANLQDASRLWGDRMRQNTPPVADKHPLSFRRDAIPVSRGVFITEF